MSISLVDAFLQQHPHLRLQTYFKASLTALSHAMEDLALTSEDPALVAASFQQENFYRTEAGRYRRLARQHQVYVLCPGESEFADAKAGATARIVTFTKNDTLADEWHLIILSRTHASCLICRERRDLNGTGSNADSLDSARVFEGIWSSDRLLAISAARLLLERVTAYRPDLEGEVAAALQAQASIAEPQKTGEDLASQPFVDRLVTHLQAGQYRLLSAYRSLAAKENRERLLATTGAAVRHSLDSQKILQAIADCIGRSLGADRAIGYRYRSDEAAATVAGEFRASASLASLQGRSWLSWHDPLGERLQQQREPLIFNAPDRESPTQDLVPLLQDAAIVRWLMVPIAFQERLLGAIELHRCQAGALPWSEETASLVAAVADRVGVILTQAEAYARLEDLNGQLAALDRTRSNLVAIAGHELRTPLSTIQVCLESLASEPDMSAELRQVMLHTALSDTERMRQLIRDFLTLSQFESGRVDWNPEAISLLECIELSLSNLRARWRGEPLPEIGTPPAAAGILPLVRVDGEWLVEVMAKLLDNACKFTAADGKVAVEVDCSSSDMVTVGIVDTGRGIEPAELERIFDRFYQEEGALQRTRNGTGLGLAICRQVVEQWGGQIWAESAGRGTGTRIAFTVPCATRQPAA